MKEIWHLKNDHILAELWGRVPQRTQVSHVAFTGATTLWDPWDTAPPNLENLGTKCVWSLQPLWPLFFPWARRTATHKQRKLLYRTPRSPRFEGENKCRKGWTIITGKQEGRKIEKKGKGIDIHHHLAVSVTPYNFSAVVAPMVASRTKPRAVA